MKNKQTKLSLNKFKIAKLNNSKSIVGGSEDCGGTVTAEDKKLCIKKSKIYIDVDD